MKKITVIKFGGSLGKNMPARKKFLDELAAISKKAGVVLVHGGGPEINEWLGKAGIKSRFVGGLRFTDAKTLEIVEMVLSGKVNKSFVSELVKRGVNAAGISGKDGRMALCRNVSKLGFVGEPVKINPKILLTLLKNGFLPVVSSLGFNLKGETLNVNADSLAMALALALKAEKLILLTDVCGVLNENNKTMPVIRPREIKGLLQKGVITGGMIPKIKACAQSVKSGIKEVWIADGCAGLSKLKGTKLCAR